MNKVGLYWTSTKIRKRRAISRLITTNALYRIRRKKFLNYSVRCVKNDKITEGKVQSTQSNNLLEPRKISGEEITQILNNNTKINNKNKMSLVLQTGNTGNVIHTEFHSTENYLLTADSKGKVVIWDLNQRKQYSSINFKDGFKDVCFVNDTVLVTAIDRRLEFWNFTNNTLIKTIKTKNKCIQVESINEQIFFNSKNVYKIPKWNSDDIEKWSSDTMIVDKFYISETGKTIAVVKGKQLSVYNFDSKKLIGTKKIKSLDVNILDSIKTISVATKSSSIITYIFNDKFKKTKVLVNNRKQKKYRAVAFSGNYGVVGNANDVITIYDLKTGRIINNFKNKGFSIHSLSVSKNGSLLAVGGESGIIKLYDFEKRLELSNLGGLIANVTSIKFSSDSTSVILGYDNGQIKKWNLKNHEIKTLSIKRNFVDKLIQAKYEIHGLNTDYPTVYKHKKVGLFRKKNKTRYYKLIIDSTFTSIVLKKIKIRKVKKHYRVYNNNWEYIKYIDKKNINEYFLKSINKKIEIPISVNILSATESLDKKYILASADNGVIYFIDTETGIIKLKLLSPNKNSFFYGTTEGYYFSSKSALKSIGVRYNKMLLGFEQIDLLYNRPDKILSILNFSDEEYINLLKSAYFKRLKKLGVKESELAKIENLPKLKSNLKQIPLNTKKEDWVINVNADGKENELKAIHVLINGIPVLGKEGQKITGKKIDEEISINLSPGENHIQLFVESTSGLKSIRENSNVMLKLEYQPSLYILAIGSGKFNNESFNLEYAKKDAIDFANTFNETKIFKTVNTRKLVDNDVTKEKIEKAIEWLNKANKDDVVIVFFAGHGVLDNNLDYYLSSAKIDFTYPEKEGINYNNFENLLGNLQCRNKVLFIDACHSGEVDKDELAITNNNEVSTGSVVFRAAGAGVSHKAGKSTFELSKNLFADLRQNSGVIVVSSAGGAEYAFEGDNWSNGVFTYSFINGLKNKEADLNRDNKITLNEIQQYLSKKVPELTHGKQTPTSRVENLEKDIRLW